MQTGCQLLFGFDLVEVVVNPRDLVIFVYNLINCLAFSLQVEFVLKLPCLLQMLKEKSLSLSIFVKTRNNHEYKLENKINTHVHVA